LTVCADADRAGGKDRQSVSGWSDKLNSAMVSWSSKRQPITAISRLLGYQIKPTSNKNKTAIRRCTFRTQRYSKSSSKSEFYAVSQCTLDCIYLRRVMGMP